MATQSPIMVQVTHGCPDRRRTTVCPGRPLPVPVGRISRPSP
ncbi:hypothetical protein ACFFX0_17300 [Citricoccus parietis]|uniref:Uncharacterized protein n=1 Tax=Citricoccus parietis TaxID=592307 RepID=A0ABV5G1P8_9MICC